MQRYLPGRHALSGAQAAFEATPLVVDGTLYLSTPFNRVIALDPATGAERWTYDPHVDVFIPYVVIAAGGHGKLGSKKGDYVVAFTLP